MDDKIKSGREIVAGFFEGLEDIPGVDGKIAAVLKELYEDNNLTYKSLPNALLRLRQNGEAQSE